MIKITRNQTDNDEVHPEFLPGQWWEWITESQLRD
jgi:hypothetical protein